MEEKDISFRKDVWFNPPNLPNITERKITQINKFALIQYERINKGANFCQVINIKATFHLNPSITLGNQKWNGAAPLFINIELQINIKTYSFEFVFKVRGISKIKILNKKIEEAKAWVKKYFREASEENKFFDLIIKGIKDNKLISNPIHILNQDEEEIVIVVPKIIDKTKIIL